LVRRTLTRRDFLKVAGTGAAGTVLLGGLGGQPFFLVADCYDPYEPCIVATDPGRVKKMFEEYVLADAGDLCLPYQQKAEVTCRHYPRVRTDARREQMVEPASGLFPCHGPRRQTQNLERG
jgi:hypothetical protein